MSGESMSGDDSVFCGICGKETSIAMIVEHLVREHDYDRDELLEGIAQARIVDETERPA